MNWWKLAPIWSRTTNISNENNFKRESPPFNIKWVTFTNKEASKLYSVVKQREAAAAQKKCRRKRETWSSVFFFIFGAWHVYKPLICLSCCYLPGRYEFVSNLVRNSTLFLLVLIYMKKLRCLIGWKWVHFSCNTTRVQLCCLWKIYWCLLTSKCTRNHVVSYIKNIQETFTRVWLTENECFCHVTRVQSWNISECKLNSARAVKISFALPLTDAFFMSIITKYWAT